MARKSIKGYAEKNYYDNTRFNGGIVATNDPLNEGYFKHLVNFDISDTGQSLIPRKGFLTTTFKKDDQIHTFSNEAIYFYDESLGKYIFFDNAKGYICDFDIEEKFLTNIVEITNIDRSDIDALSYRVSISNAYGNKAIRIVDEYNVVSYVLKVSLILTSVNHKRQIKPYWLKLFYRENASEYAGVSYEADTLVISYLDTNQVVNYVDPSYRNLAYGGSIIPDPMQEVYALNQYPLEHYDRFPIIYVKSADGKYLINEIKDTDINTNGYKVIPNFYITEYDSTSWGYAYDIISTGVNNLLNSNESSTYKSPIFYLNDNTFYLNLNTITSYIKYYTEISFKNVIGENASWTDFYNKNIPLESFLKIINGLKTPYIFNKDIPEYIIYIVPIVPTSMQYTIDLSREDLLGPFGLFTHFSTTTAYYNDTQAAQGEERSIQGAERHNSYVESLGTLLSSKYCYEREDMYRGLRHFDTNSLDALLDSMFSDLGIYVKKVNDYKNLNDNIGSYQDSIQTMFSSPFYSWYERPMTVDEFRNSTLYSDVKDSNIAVRLMEHAFDIRVKTQNASTDLENYSELAERLFPGIFNTNASTLSYYWTCTIVECYNSEGTLNPTYFYPYENPMRLVYTTVGSDDLEHYCNDITRHPYYSLFYWDAYSDEILSNVVPFIRSTTDVVEISSNIYTSIFTKNSSDILIGNFDLNNNSYKHLLSNKYFDNGLNIIFYLIKLPEEDTLNLEQINRDFLLSKLPKLYNTRYLVPTTKEPSTYIEQLIDDPKIIASAKNAVSYDSLLGSHLVLYTGNKLYISEPGLHYYFTQYNKFEYPEPIVKVIQYKEILLVFTTQNLYAVHLEEVTTQVANGTNEDGSTKYVQESSYEFRSHTVLYNLMVNEKYADAIQVYNQMVLFYSADGQMFLIKPTAAITSDTRFSIQYFNKSVNDILLNYKEYIKQRLQMYGLDDTIDNVDIKVSANINYIKVFYSTDKITYILVYDVLNNRYYVYDTVAFSNIKYLHYIPSGELYITERDNNLYFTVPYTDTNMVDNNVDISYYDYFNPYEINAEIDTGVINLNNHLKKRFKDLHVIYKNLNANNVEFSLETYVDDVPIITYINSTFEVRNLSSFDTLVVVDNYNVVQLIDNTALFSFIDYTSNKIITHKTNIVSKGKTIRIKMKYRSKGKYKIQGFGLIYKEHTV